jgi:hypothetical protein
VNAEGEGEEDAAISANANNSNNAYLDGSNATLDKGGITTTTSILYTPLVSTPRFYTC